MALIFSFSKKECCGGVWIRTSLVLMYGKIVNVEYYHVVTKKAFIFFERKTYFDQFWDGGDCCILLNFSVAVYLDGKMFKNSVFLINKFSRLFPYWIQKLNWMGYKSDVDKSIVAWVPALSNRFSCYKFVAFLKMNLL